MTTTNRALSDRIPFSAVERSGDDPEWWRRAVIYEIAPISFQDSNGDGKGDLNGLIARLDYLEWLGVNAVWLTPVYRSPMLDFGYDVADFCDVDPIFGSLAVFDRLVAKLRERGIRLIPRFRAQSHLRQAHLVRRKSLFAQECSARLVCLGRSGAGRRAAEQLVESIWRERVGVGQPAAAMNS